MHAEIVAIGDEITSGQLLDTNSQWLSQRLEEVGVRTLYHSTVGDELAPSAEVFRRAIDRADLVVATGGLGPTADDLTREALAQATGRALQLNPDALEYIRSMFARRNWPMPKQNELQAMFPTGSRPIINPHGTAPGIDLEAPREGQGPCRVICLPGVPAEVVEMWHDSVAAAIERFVGQQRRVVRRRRIHCFGAGESRIESMLPDMIRRGHSPVVGITASKATITLRIAAEGATDLECLAMIEPAAATIRQCLGTLIFGEEDDELQDVVIRMLRERGQTLASSEGATAGLVAEWLAGVDGAESVYRGGLVAPPLAVPSNDECCSSVERMAADCRERFGVDFGLAVGRVTPEPCDKETAAQQHGDSPSVTFALATAAGVQQKTIPCGIHPALVQIYLAKWALNLVRLALLG